MTDYVPELLVGDPFGVYEAINCIAYGAITKGDPVSLVEDQGGSSYAVTDIASTPPQVATAATSAIADGIAMKSAASGAEIPILVRGFVKLLAQTASDLDAGSSCIAYKN